MGLTESGDDLTLVRSGEVERDVGLLRGSLLRTQVDKGEALVSFKMFQKAALGEDEERRTLSALASASDARAWTVDGSCSTKLYHRARWTWSPFLMIPMAGRLASRYKGLVSQVRSYVWRGRTGDEPLMAPQSSKSLEPSECPPKKVLPRSRGDERVSKSLPAFTDRLTLTEGQGSRPGCQRSG